MKRKFLFGSAVLALSLAAGIVGGAVAQAEENILEFTPYSEIVCNEDGYATGFRPQDTVSFLKNESLKREDVRVIGGANGDVLDDSAFVGTGAEIQSYKFKNKWAGYLAVVKGDINGDGQIKSTDYLKLKKHFSGGSYLLTGAYEKAADLSGDGQLKSVDYLMLKKYFSGTVELFEPREDKEIKYEGPYSEINGTYGGVDDLGRELHYDNYLTVENTDNKEVGMFYFLWLGSHGTFGPYNNTQILKNNPKAIYSEFNWLKAGGGNQGHTHHWDEPLLGYYTLSDRWVVEKEVQMLTEAGIDYIIFDTTNGFTYDDAALLVFSVLDKYAKLGYDVPKATYYTRNDPGQVSNLSTETLQHIYDVIYKGHPEYQYLWYKINGKPMIIGSGESKEVAETFTMQRAQWPQEAKTTYGFPWMEFSRYLTKDSVHRLLDKRTVMSASAAQHNDDIMFSTSAWYGGKDRLRSFRGNKTFGLYHQDMDDEQAMRYGTNLEMNFEYCMYKGAGNIFLTGWNEWGAQRLAPFPKETIVFCDCASDNASRDMEPSAGILKDNYLMQFSNLIKEFKGADPRVDIGESKTINISGAWSQWDDVTAKYTDFVQEIGDRDAIGFGDIHYTNTTGKNDLSMMKTAYDADNFYFYVETVDEIKELNSASTMTLLLRSHGATTDYENSWEGFDYIVNGTTPKDGKMTVEKFNKEYNSRTTVGTVEFRSEGNKLMVKVPKSLIGVSSTELIDIQFKWADNATTGEVLSFYTDGDTAPYGRYTYIFSEKENYTERKPVFD